MMAKVLDYSEYLKPKIGKKDPLDVEFLKQIMSLKEKTGEYKIKYKHYY